MAVSMFKLSSALINSSKNFRCVVRLVDKANFSTTNVAAVSCIIGSTFIGNIYNVQALESSSSA